MQRRGEKNLEKPQKWKKIRLKLLKCEKAENKFKILARSQKVTHPSRISHYIMVAEVKKPKKATWLKKVKAEKLNVLSSSSRNSITWPRRCAVGKKGENQEWMIGKREPWRSCWNRLDNTLLLDLKVYSSCHASNWLHSLLLSKTWWQVVHYSSSHLKEKSINIKFLSWLWKAVLIFNCLSYLFHWSRMFWDHKWIDSLRTPWDMARSQRRFPINEWHPFADLFPNKMPLCIWCYCIIN